MTACYELSIASRYNAGLPDNKLHRIECGVSKSVDHFAVNKKTMEHTPEHEVVLPHALIQLATVNWEGVEETPPYPGYVLSQRLSENHPPLRIGNMAAAEILPRVHSVGFLPPGCPIRLLPVEKPLRVLYCMFDTDYFEEVTGIAQTQWDQQLGSLLAIKNKRLEILMQEIYGELMQPDFGYERVLESVSVMILVELSRYSRQLSQKKSGEGVLAPWQLRRIQERIQASQQLGYPSLAELAALCGISQGHLARTFKASTGWQIHKYIAEERLKAAKQLLAEAQMSCEEVSACLGFKSSAYFSTVFRRMTGQTPSEYRNAKRAEK